MGNSPTGKKKDSCVMEQRKQFVTKKPVTESESECVVESYVFSVENIVFQDGANNLLAYCGAVRVLEDGGLWNQIQRLAGCGTGAVIAVMLALGYNSQQLEHFITSDLRCISQDSGPDANCFVSCGGTRMYGRKWNRKLLDCVSLKMASISGSQDVTFAEVYSKCSKELCIVTTNISQGCMEYCHYKTTPDLPVRVAIQMSLATPGVYQPVKHVLHGVQQYYASGSLLSSYPLHCFDGWWLSLKLSDSFFNRIPSSPQHFDDDYRFGIINKKTMGLIVSDETFSGYPTQLAVKFRQQKFPHGTNETNLAKLRQKERNDKTSRIETDLNSGFMRSANKFFNLLSKRSVDPRTISVNEFQEILNTELASEEVAHLFGNLAHVKSEDLCQEIKLLERRVDLVRTRIQTAHTTLQPIANSKQYFYAVESTLQTACLKNLHKPDIDRTVCINTGYIRRSDLATNLEPKDKLWLVECGKIAMQSYLDDVIGKVTLLTATHQPANNSPNTVEGSGNGRVVQSTFRDSYSPEDLLTSYIDDDTSEIIDERDYTEEFREKPCRT